MRLSSTTGHNTDFSMSRARLLRAYLQEIRAELLRYLRMPSYAVPTLVFPALFYLLFAVLIGSPGRDAARMLLAGYTTFGVMAPGLFGFGIALAMERENGLLQLKRALPAPAYAYPVGKMAMAMLTSGLIAVFLGLLAVGVAAVELSLLQCVRLLLVAMLGALPFCALGLLIGCLIKGQGAIALTNVVYLPMAVLSGLWFPLKLLPPLLQQWAVLWPAHHLHQLARWALELPVAQVWPHVLWLMVFTVAATALAGWRLRRYG